MKKIKAKNYIRLIGIVLLFYVLYTANLKELWVILKKIDGKYMILACFVLIVLYLLKSLRWQNLLKNQGVIYPFRNSFIVYLASNYVAFITPGRIGEAIKVLYLKEDLKISYAKSFPTVVIDRFFDMYFLLMVSAIGIIRFSIFRHFSILSWVILLIIVVSPWLLFHKRSATFLIKFFFFPFSHLKQKGLNFYDDFIAASRSIMGFNLFYSFLLTVGAYGVLFFCGYLIAMSMGLPVSYYTLAIFISVANILSFIPISFSGIGTREASLIYLFSLISIGKEVALVFSVLLFFVFFVCGGLYGFIAYTYKPVDIKKIISRNKE